MQTDAEGLMVTGVLAFFAGQRQAASVTRQAQHRR